jgi:hypothetical protein
VTPALRVKGLLARHGEDFTVGGQVRRGVFSNATYGAMRMYLTQAEIDATTPPYWTALVAPDDPTVVGDTLSWNSRTLLVKRVAEGRLMGAVAAKMLVLV